MASWIALLRGINVGGNNILPMKELREVLASMGFDNISTYIQSGNCVFDAEDESAPSLTEKIENAIDTKFGFKPKVLILRKEELKNAALANPYPEDLNDPKSVHLFFLTEPATNGDIASLHNMKKPTEHFELTDQVFYLHAPEGIGRSKLAAQVEKKLGVSVTARNLRSVIKILELCD